jgi:hypothetical protein
LASEGTYLHLTPSPTRRRSDPREVAGSARRLPSEAFSKPKEGNPKQRGRKFKGKGSEIQNFSFRQSRLFNGLNRNSKEKSDILDVRPIINMASRL